MALIDLKLVDKADLDDRDQKSVSAFRMLELKTSITDTWCLGYYWVIVFVKK